MVDFTAKPPLPVPVSREEHNWAHRQFLELQRLSEGVNRPLVMRWQGSWESGAIYQPGDVVLDWPYLMIANTPTDERPAPTPQGDPAFLYSGAAPTVQTTAKTLTFGTNFANPNQAFYFTSYRIYTVAGNRYRSYFEVNGQITELFVFTADTTGWQVFERSDQLVPQNSDFTLFVEVQEPDPTPTTFTGDWDYDTPNNESQPAPGVISHANQATGILNVSTTDNGGGDRRAELIALTPGDTIEGAGVRWSIQSVSDQISFVSFGVAPSQQGGPDGVQTFTFETVTATPITVMSDPGYWSSLPNVQSFYSLDGADPVVTQDAYGVDIEVQDVLISDAWDVLAISGGGGGGSYDDSELRGRIEALEAIVGDGTWDGGTP